MSITDVNLEIDEKIIPMQREWSGYWIAPPVYETGYQKGDYPKERFLFRREVSLDQAQGLTLFISAGARYELYINQARITEGPPSGQPHNKYYDQIQLDSYVKRGLNCFAVVVTSKWDEPIGLLMELRDAENKVLLRTDTDWKITSNNGWRNAEFPYHGLLNTSRQEIFDARKHPQGWELVGFDDSGWSNAEFKSYAGELPWYNMVPRGIPLLAEEVIIPQTVTCVEEGMDIECRDVKESLSTRLSAPGQPIKYTLAENVDSLLSPNGCAQFRCSLNHLQDRAFDGIWSPGIVLDFGKVHMGYFEVDIEGPEGAFVEIGYVERLTNGYFNNSIQVPNADRYALRNGRQTFRCINPKTYRYVKIRFMRSFETVNLYGVRGISCGYPYENKGNFTSSDITLEKCFEISRHTIRLCSFDMFTDSPWRENAQWLGDVSAVTLGGVYACFGDTDSQAKFLRQAMEVLMPNGLLSQHVAGFYAGGANSRGYYRVLATYSLWWVYALWNHYQYTGNRSFIDEGYPMVTRIILFHLKHLNKKGIITGLSDWTFFDHTFKVHRKGHESALYTAFFHGVAKLVRQMAELKNDRYMIEKISHVRKVTKANFHNRFFDEKTGVYADCRDRDGALKEYFSEHTNMGAILWDLCPEELTDSIVDKLYVTKEVDYWEAIPFAAKIVCEALEHCGRMDIAMDIIRERWGKRMVDQDMTSTPEEWNASGSWRGENETYYGIYRSLSHAWSAAPAEFLIKQMIGLKILEPGCRSVSLSPYKGEFDYNVTYPTPAGNISVQYKNGEMTVKAPDITIVEY